ncbi:MAG: M48 family metallopeptidase [Candidatus Gracilibacteria bacterium]
MIPKSKIRTRAELPLFVLAIITSTLIWFLIGNSYVTYFLKLAEIEPEGTCVVFLNKDTGSISYYFEHQMSNNGITIFDCLPDSQLSDNIRTRLKEAGIKESARRVAEESTSMIFLFYFMAIVLFIYLSTALMMGRIRLNGVRLSEKQYGAFYKIYAKTAHELGLKKIPHAYIVRATGEVNAFAVKVSHKRMIVFYAELIEALVEGKKYDELKAVAAHELTHVYLRHINYWLFLFPFRIIPFLGSMYSRQREYSADRGAYMLLKNEGSCTQAFIKLVAGKFMAKEIDVDEYLEQPKTEHGIFAFLAKITGTHPPIPYRIQAIRKLAKK